MFVMWHRPSPSAAWLKWETFTTRAEAERLMRFCATAGQFILSSLGGRPDPSARPDFTVVSKRRIVRRTSSPTVDPRIHADGPGRGVVRDPRGDR